MNEMDRREMVIDKLTVDQITKHAQPCEPAINTLCSLHYLMYCTVYLEIPALPCIVVQGVFYSK